MPMIEGAGVALAVAQAGDGPPALVVHDLASNAAALAPLCSQLAAAGRRVTTYDRRGYGASGAPDVYTATTIHEQAEDAACVLHEAVGEPALIVGLGFGALVALDVLVRHAELVHGAVLADPPVFAFDPAANEPLSAERLALEDALRAGGPEQAVLAWGGTDPADARAFLADYAGRSSWSPSRRELRAIAVPVTVVVTEQAPAHVVQAARALLRELPDGREAPGVPEAVAGHAETL